MNFQSVLTAFETQLDAIDKTQTDILFIAETGISHCEKYIKTLRQAVIASGFESQQDEIHFFKHVKPQIMSKLIYYVKLHHIECKRPRSSTKFQVKYLNAHINKLQLYFNDNLEFYHYYRRGATTLDTQYFLRGQSDLRFPTASYHYFTDDAFSTCQDHTVATIMAFDMLIVYLQQEIEKLENDTDNAKTSHMKHVSKLFWTGSKTDLIELIYALHASGSINSGTADIKEIAVVFETLFNMDLGNYYHTFIEIRARKHSRTKFLDRLVDGLNQRCDASDE
ncbi:RteC domain-containing protein [Tamlana fucoidanivorans]|uniref:Tetracycline regulation of excision, RteC n=1 Tax=Allotamlana fucoidanivorans TaxID=2583814 RepID=A0A5C4SQK7_9FLAO|nr:RteC domain-containing protein [Tamlana fucoidanivorans]TNJ46075.1 tetracycline regulation of excision, RteC [Tamlana fucoidanivorans]